jgi:hypothetical protein
MNHKVVRTMLAVPLVVCFFGTMAAQGLYWESKVTGGPMGEKVTKSYAMPKKFKTEGAGETVIARLDKELFIMMNPEKKEYSEMTFAEMEDMVKKMGSKMDGKMAEMQKKLKGMPEEQRKMVEQMMGDRMGAMKKEARIEVQSTGDKQTINGFACRKYVMTSDGKDMMTLWTTKDVKGFEEMRKDWQEFSKRMMAMNPMRQKGIAEGMTKVDGFPIQTEMGMGITNTVTKVEKRSTPASEFEVPAGYKKVKPKWMGEVEKMDKGEKEDKEDHQDKE